MSEEQFRVVFVGEVEEGRDLVVVRNQLTALGLLSAEQAVEARPGRAVVIESGLTKDQAQHYSEALKATGARCRLVASPGVAASVGQPAAVQEAVTLTATPVAVSPGGGPATVTSGSLELPPPVTPGSSLALLRDTDLNWNFDEVEAIPLANTLELSGESLDTPAAADREMTCPKCGLEQPKVEECQACGVIVSKFRQMPSPQPVAGDGVVASVADGQMAGQGQAGGQIYDGVQIQVTKSSYTEDEGFFGPEKRGIDKGVLGGITMMVIAVVWFGVGWMAGFVFFYPPILFLFGLFAFFKGLLTGKLAGG